ncbi:MAG: GEVED domain-containing protein, partial [Bacteroidota bacterium]
SNFNLDCLAPDMLAVDNLNDVSAFLSWAKIDSARNYSFRYREGTSSMWIDSVLSDTFLLLDQLSPCTNYIFQVSANCNGDSSGFLASRRFRTEGCCEAAPGFRATDLDSTQVSLAWEEVFGANAYILQYREVGQSIWNQLSINGTDFLLDNLQFCTAYELSLGTDCGNPDTNFTQILQIQTPGCGFCLDNEYCEARGNVTQFEWIEAVKIGPIQNVSGSNGGYEVFSDPDYILAEDSAYVMTLEHGFVGLAGRQHWRIWIDANQDGQFATDGSELFFATDLPIDGEFSDTLKTPGAIIPGNTRMRISMKFEGTINPQLPPEVCETFEFGEVEDYCIQILPKGSLSTPPLYNPDFLKVYPNPFQNQMVIESEQAILDWQLFDAQGRLLKEEHNLRNYERLLNLGDFPSGIYYLKIHTEKGTSSKKILKN